MMNVQLYQSDEFATTFDLRGNCIAFRITEPHECYPLSRIDRLILAHFDTRQPLFLWPSGNSNQSLLGRETDLTDEIGESLRRLTERRLLVPYEESTSRYTDPMITAYALSRRIPDRVIETITTAYPVRESTRILDLCTGAGDLAIQLAQRTAATVSGLDKSAAFVKKAIDAARAKHVNVTLEIGSAEKLLFDDRVYDVITLSQAFHWLEPYWATKGVYRALIEDGALFMIESKASLLPEHPLRRFFGYGVRTTAQIMDECQRHAFRYAQLFHMLRPDTYELTNTVAYLFRQQRSFDIHYARAYLLDDVVRSVFPQAADPWEPLRDAFNCARYSLDGSMYWLVICFRKLSTKVRTAPRLAHFEIHF